MPLEFVNGEIGYVLSEEESSALRNAAAPEAKSQVESGDFMRNLRKTIPQTAQLMGGTLAFIGETAGIDSLKQHGLDVYQRNEAVVGELSRPQDEFINVLNGTASALDFVQGALGYVTGQAAEAGASALAGSILGSAIAGPAGTAGGAVGGAVGKRVARGLIKEFVDKQIDKRAVDVVNAANKAGRRLAVEGGIEAERAAARDIAKKSLAKELGQAAGLLSFNLTQELGSIYPEALAEAEKEGRSLTGTDLFRVAGSAAGAAALESWADKIGLKKALGGGKGAGLGARALREVPLGVAREAGTEAAQTAVERFGAQQELTGEDAIKAYINAAAIGAVGGGALGGVTALQREKQIDRTMTPEEKLRSGVDAEEFSDQLDQILAKGEVAVAENQKLAQNLGAGLRDVSEALTGKTPTMEAAALGLLDSGVEPQAEPQAADETLTPELAALQEEPGRKAPAAAPQIATEEEAAGLLGVKPPEAPAEFVPGMEPAEPGPAERAAALVPEEKPAAVGELLQEAEQRVAAATPVTPETLNAALGAPAAAPTLPAARGRQVKPLPAPATETLVPRETRGQAAPLEPVAGQQPVTPTETPAAPAPAQAAPAEPVQPAGIRSPTGEITPAPEPEADEQGVVRELGQFSLSERASVAKEEIEHRTAYRTFVERGAASNPEGVTKFAKHILSGWAVRPGLNVINDMNEAPAPVRAAYAAKVKSGARGAPTAFLHRDEIYVVRSALSGDPKEAALRVVKDLYHEGVAHYGARRVFRKQMVPIYDRAARLYKGKIMERALAYGLAPKIERTQGGTFTVNGTGAYRTMAEARLAQTEVFLNDKQFAEQRAEAFDEVVAKLVENPKNHSLPVVKEFIAAIRSFLRPIIKAITGQDLALTDNEIIRDFIKPLRQAIVSGRLDKSVKDMVSRKYGAGHKRVPVGYSPLSVDEQAATETQAVAEQAAEGQPARFRLEEPHVTKTGRVIGAPAGRTTPKDRDRIVRRLTDMLESPLSVAEESVNWYEDSGRTIREVARGKPDLIEKITRLFAVYSQANGVGSNVTAVVESMRQIAETGLNSPEAGRFPSVTSARLPEILSAKEMSLDLDGVNDKVLNFYRNLIDPAKNQNKYEDASTMDRWMMRLMGYRVTDDEDVGGAGALNQTQYAYARDVMRRVSDEHKKRTGQTLKPRQIQAALWTNIKNQRVLEQWLEVRKKKRAEAAAIQNTDPERARKLRESAKNMTLPVPTTKSFSDYVSRAMAMVTWETVSSTDPTLGWLPRADKEIVSSWTKAARGILLDENGNDELMRELGLTPLYKEEYSVGSYQGVISPNIITGVVLTRTPGEPRVSKAGEEYRTQGKLRVELANAYASALGYLYRQQAVMWHRADENVPLKKSVAGYSIVAGGPTTARFDKALYRHLRETLGGVEFTKIGDNEFRLLNVRNEHGHPASGIKDADFASAITAALDSFSGYGVVADGKSFRAEVGYIESGADNENYLSWFREIGRPDLQGWLDGKRAALEALNREFGARVDGQQGIRGRDEEAGTRAAASTGEWWKGLGAPEVAVKPQSKHSETFVAVHYSTTPGLTELDPKKAGSAGTRGPEIRRFGLGQYGQRGGIAARLYFYVQPSKGDIPKKESVVNGVHRYRTVLRNVYNAMKDPLKLVQAVKDARHGAFNEDAFEEEVSKRGFDGYYADGIGGSIGDTGVVTVMDVGDATIKATRFSMGVEGHQSQYEVMQNGDFETFSVYDGDLNEVAGPFQSREAAMNALDKVRQEAAEATEFIEKGPTAMEQVTDFVDFLTSRSKNFLRWFSGSAAVETDDFDRQFNEPTHREIMAIRGKFGAEADRAWDRLSEPQRDAATRGYRAALMARGHEWSKGDPVRWYHGTAADISVFRGKMIFLTRNPELAQSFADSAAYFSGGAANIMPMYAQTKNPFDFENEAHLRAVRKLVEKEVPPEVAGAIMQEVGSGAWDAIESEPVFTIIKDALGHDGIYVYEAGEKNLAVFSPLQLKSVFNRGTFSKVMPSVSFSLAGVADPMDNTFQIGAGMKERALRQPGNRQTWDAPAESSFWDRILYMFQDKQIDLKRVVNAIKSATGALEAAIDPYAREILFHGRAAERTKKFWRTEMLPLLNEMTLRGVSQEDFEDYLVARQAKETNKLMRARNPGAKEPPSGWSGMSDVQAEQFIAKLSPTKKRHMEALSSMVDKITEGTRQTLVDYGLETQETINGWKKAFPNYIPLHREDRGNHQQLGEGFSVRGAFSRSRVGSARKVVSVLANIAQQRDKAIVKGEKNRVGNALYALAKSNPNHAFWRLDDNPPMKTSVGLDGVVHRYVDRDYKRYDHVVVTKLKDKDGSIREVAVIFDDTPGSRSLRAAMAIKNLDAPDMGEFMGAASKVTRYFAAINTQYNPIFGIVNLFRDVQTGLLNLQSTPLRGQQDKVLKMVPAALRGIFAMVRAERTGKALDAKWAQEAKEFEEFRAVGGQTGFRDMFHTAEERGKAIKSELKKLQRAGEPIGKLESFFGTDGAMLNALSDYNTAMENAVRLAVYKAAKEQLRGNGPVTNDVRERAAVIAKNITVNFNKKGQMGSQIGAMYAFFNASVQGTARMLETLAGPTGKKIIYGGLLAGAVQALMLSGYDEDEPPEFVRQRSFIIPFGDEYVSLPMPLGFHVIPNLSRIGMEIVLSGFRNPGEKAANMIDVLADAFNPIGNAGLSMQTIAPTGIDPLVALAENRDWTGKPIARPDYSPLVPEPGTARAKDTASVFGKMAASALNAITGGTEFQAGMLSPTPDQIDYLIGQVTGGVGREALKGLQTLEASVTGEEVPLYKIPAVGRFVGTTTGQAPQASRYYQNLKRINAHELELKGRREKKMPVGEYLRDNPEARLVGVANSFERRISRLRRQKRRLLDEGASPDRIRTIENLLTDQYTAFNERVKEVSGG